MFEKGSAHILVSWWDPPQCWLFCSLFYNVGTYSLIVFSKSHCAVPHERATLGRNQHSAWLATVFLCSFKRQEQIYSAPWARKMPGMLCIIQPSIYCLCLILTGSSIFSMLFGAAAMNDPKRRRPDLYKYINRVNSQCCRPVYWSSFKVFNASNGHRRVLFSSVSHVKPEGSLVWFCSSQNWLV